MIKKPSEFMTNLEIVRRIWGKGGLMAKRLRSKCYDEKLSPIEVIHKYGDPKGWKQKQR